MESQLRKFSLSDSVEKCLRHAIGFSKARKVSALKIVRGWREKKESIRRRRKTEASKPETPKTETPKTEALKIKLKPVEGVDNLRADG